MTKYFCGMFDFYSELRISVIEIDGVYNTKDALSRFIDRFRNSTALAGEDYYVCITTEHKSNVMVYKVSYKLNSNGKLVTSAIPLRNLDKEKVDVFVSCTLSSPE
jgi:hypothetical protein